MLALVRELERGLTQATCALSLRLCACDSRLALRMVHPRTIFRVLARATCRRVVRARVLRVKCPRHLFEALLTGGPCKVFWLRCAAALA